MKKPLTAPAILCLLTALLSMTACGTEAPADHEKALPHNLEQAGSISPQDAEQLATAKGKTAVPIASGALLKRLAEDSAGLLVLNFWKTDCLPCLSQQLHLQLIQQQAGDDKMHILTVSLDDETATDRVNLHLRQGGITSPVYILKKEGKPLRDFSETWDGSLPALLIRTHDGLRQFYQQDFSENERTALLQPLLL